MPANIHALAAALRQDAYDLELLISYKRSVIGVRVYGVPVQEKDALIAFFNRQRFFPPAIRSIVPRCVQIELADRAHISR